MVRNNLTGRLTNALIFDTITRSEHDSEIRQLHRLIAALVARLGGEVSFNTEQWDEAMAGDPERGRAWTLQIHRDDAHRSVTMTTR